ncbi:hypothetical protein FGB62_90g02 [Gracilaria domingensis]|nr:hypothetical protein FGB62_90g02 [Gracilaria domingensis]
MLDADADADSVDDPEAEDDDLLRCSCIRDSDLVPVSVGGLSLDLVELELAGDEFGFDGAAELFCLPLDSLSDPVLFGTTQMDLTLVSDATTVMNYKLTAGFGPSGFWFGFVVM